MTRPDVDAASHDLAEELGQAGTDVLAVLIRRHAEIDDELERRGANALIEEREAIRARIKDGMAQIDRIEYVDETSGYRALITPTFTDVYDKDKLIPMLPRLEMADEALETVVNVPVIKEWERGGILNRTAMQQAGALLRKLRSRALHVEPIKGDRTEIARRRRA